MSDLAPRDHRALDQRLRSRQHRRWMVEVQHRVYLNEFEEYSEAARLDARMLCARRLADVAAAELAFLHEESAPIRFRSQPTWLFAPVQEHSHKPEEQYAIIERCSRGPYLELFARRRRPGWHCWGNEVDADVVL